MATVEILNSSETAEWYTPQRYIDAVREVLGPIDLDPASCAEANRTVQASRYFRSEDDGLSLPWIADNIFLNPPYGLRDGKSNQWLWSRYAISEYRRGAFREGIVLVNACTSEKWFQPLWGYPTCFTDHRIQFDGGSSRQPTKGNAFVYLGHGQSFVSVFRRIGVVVPSALLPVRECRNSDFLTSKTPHS